MTNDYALPVVVNSEFTVRNKIKIKHTGEKKNAPKKKRKEKKKHKASDDE